MASPRDPASANTARRRARLLAHPLHGPRLLRLTKAQQREVLELRGTAARRRLTELDAARRAHARDLAAARRARTDAQVVQHILDAHGRRANPATVEANVAAMTRAEKKRTLTMDGLQMAQAARGPLVRRGPREFNPWWYH